jgi:hypothetical protein
LCKRKETAARKAAVSNGRVKWLLYDGFFSFAVVRQLSFHIEISNIMCQNLSG